MDSPLWIVDGHFLLRTNGAFSQGGMVWIKNEPAKRLSAEPSLAGTYVSDSGEKIALAKDGTATIKAPKPDWPAVSAAYTVKGKVLVLYIQAKPLQTVTFKVGDG
jgi:hypothetical protein